MDDSRFDRIARLFGAAFGRRAMAGSLVAVALSAAAPAAAKSSRNGCARDGERCGKHGGKCSRCCSKFAVYTSDGLIPDGGRRCACRPDSMRCTRNRQCCNGLCNPATGVCDDGKPGSPPAVCVTSVNFCQPEEQNCGSTTQCWCVTTNSDEMLCANGQFNCASNFGDNITCNDDNDCFVNYGEGWACVAMTGCKPSVACSGGTACALTCGL
jgi:hypothetical protein